MKKSEFIKKLIVLIFGLYLFGLGNTFIYYSGIGFDSWNVFHDGLSVVTGLNIGTTAVMVSVFMMICAMLLGEPLGIGTILNGTLIGTFLQLHINSGFFKTQNSLPIGLIYLFIGMFLIAFGSYFYMKQGIGSGPRDSFSLGLSKKINMKMGYVKSMVEVLAVIAGIFLGGKFGLATVISAFMTGIIVQFVFDILKFNVKAINQKNAKETIEELLKKEAHYEK